MLIGVKYILNASFIGQVFKAVLVSSPHLVTSP